MIDDKLAAPPFNLDPEAIGWVNATFALLSPDDRIRQLFVLRSGGYDAAVLEQQRMFRPGGITRVIGADLEAEQQVIAAFNAAAPVPLTISADLEGSRMSPAFGTETLNPLGLAAIDDPQATRQVYRIMAEEARAAGINWSLTPVLDINAAFRSAIVATRGYGSDVATIERHALIQLDEFQRAGVAATAKHFPGEGFDDRDQHLVTTINPLSVADWEISFGRLYRAAIEAGVMSVMSAHIAFPAFVRALDPEAGVEAFRPATISRVLNQTLLREKLGFNGLIVSDATPMAGLGSWSSRKQSLPEVVANGCDVILFSNDPETDLTYLQAAVADGRLPVARLEEAVLRILGFKAAVGLHRPQAARIEAARSTPEKRAIAEAVIRRAPTLVKDVQNLLPLDPQKHRRVLVITPGIVDPWAPVVIPFILPKLLEEKGFAVTPYTPDIVVSEEAFDLVLYLFGEETLMTRNHIFIDWLRLTGNPYNAMRRHWHDIPTLMISFGYPYLLYDAPRVPTYINAYMTTDTMQRTVVEALLGNYEWNRNSPVDPFCGLEDARY